VLINVQEAAEILGLKSRGSIYRKIKSGELSTVMALDGTPRLHREGIEERWAAITRTRTDSPRPLRSRVDQPRPQAKPRESQPPQRADEPLPEYNESRARSEYEKANLLELDRKTKEGQLLKREDVEQAWNAAVNITRTKVLGVPSRAKQQIPHLTPDEVEVVRDLLREALEELAAGEVTA
jgi:hypothetical protein